MDAGVFLTSQRTSSRLAEAFAYAEEIHRGQARRKTEAPTLSHLMAVASLVMENGGDEDQAIAALLHDGPEDCGGRAILERIRERFGDLVAALVEDCTDTMESPKPDWQTRKRKYLDHLETVGDKSLLISICDKVHNARSLVAGYRQEGDAFWDRFTATPRQTLWYYTTLLEIFRRRRNPQIEPLISQLGRSVRQLQEAIQGTGARLDEA